MILIVPMKAGISNLNVLQNRYYVKQEFKLFRAFSVQLLKWNVSSLIKQKLLFKQKRFLGNSILRIMLNCVIFQFEEKIWKADLIGHFLYPLRQYFLNGWSKQSRVFCVGLKALWRFIWAIKSNMSNIFIFFTIRVNIYRHP